MKSRNQLGSGVFPSPCTSAPHLWLLLLLLLLFLSCDRQGTPTSSSGAQPATTGPSTKVKLQLNWVPEPQFGGFYEAQRTGAYSKHGLDVDVVAGGAGTPTVQMIGAGTVPFGVVSADEVVVARSRGNDVVALFAVYQTCPQGIMTHGSRGLKGIEDVFKQPGTLAMQAGLPYAAFLVKKFGTAPGLRVVPSPGGSIAAFLAAPNFSQQCFITSEPVLAKQQGADPVTFLVADAGYNPYTTVLATSGSYLNGNRDVVNRMVAAVREGWLSYVNDPGPGNELMQGMNRTMDARTFAESAAAQKPLIVGEKERHPAVGSMTRERWQTLVQQLNDLKVIEKAPAAEECFVEPAPQ
jgi:NitT/TauT family transport system substrate-binding protein